MQISFQQSAFSFQRERLLLNMKGFSLIEPLIAVVIISISLVAIASVTVAVIKENQVSDHVTEATIVAQDLLEELKNKEFVIGTDGQISAGDTIDASLNNSSGTDFTAAANSAIFADPDHAFDINADGSEKLDINGNKIVLNAPTVAGLTPNASYLLRTWSIIDNSPVDGMKEIIVVVGWVEAGMNRYIRLSASIAGRRFDSMDNTI